ncbi:MAG: retropepsin-like domain-containing protein [Alphaproteobacteria bacterium]|nr:retropepsin-like domain-containing protein [Alphaproteobacteria bacterium]MBV9418493.1 retropepsin-like domain-containing protein [Alphaproteobacteria bacterium]
MRRALLAVLLACGCGSAAAAPLTVPFDYSRQAIGLYVTVKGTPLYLILDTGVDPSAIDTKRAIALGLPVQHEAGEEASGEGNDVSARIFPATIEGLTIAGRDFPAVDAAAMDMSQLSARYGKPLDGVLGYSFLNDRVVLINYPQSTIGILDTPSDAAPVVAACRTRYSIPLRSYEGDSIPIIPDFRFGKATAPISYDTGANSGIAFLQNALDMPGVRAALTEKGDVVSVGARGAATTKGYVLNLPVGFGPFALPAGQVVSVRPANGTMATRMANIGNPIFAALKLKVLLNYRAKLITFYGDC